MIDILKEKKSATDELEKLYKELEQRLHIDCKNAIETWPENKKYIPPKTIYIMFEEKK